MSPPSGQRLLPVIGLLWSALVMLAPLSQVPKREAPLLPSTESGPPLIERPTSPLSFTPKEPMTIDHYMAGTGPLLLPFRYTLQSPEDLVVGPQDVGAVFDRLAQAALPDGRGAVVLGEVHQHAGTHRFYRLLLDQSKSITCLMMEYPSDLQRHVQEYVTGAPCEDSWMKAETKIFNDASQACYPNMRRRTVDAAIRNRRAIDAIDVSYNHGPVAEWRHAHANDGDDSAILLTGDARLILDFRNKYMADQIRSATDLRSCVMTVIQTGRAHAVDLLLPVAGRIPPLEDRLYDAGLDAITWPVVDVSAELNGRQRPRWAAARFVMEQGRIAAVFLESNGVCYP